MSDLIRREDAIKAILGVTTYDKVEAVAIHCDASVAYSEGWLGGIRDSQRAIEDVPSAEPERKKGKWMEKESFDNADYEIPVWQSARCSVCGKYMTAPYAYSFKEYPYCPNCGSYNGDDNEK